MRVEIGPVSRESALSWLHYADVTLEVLRDVGPDRASGDALDAFGALLQEWHSALGASGDFHWVAERSPDEVGFMLNALYEAGLAVEESHAAGRAELRPAAADEFHFAVVNQAMAHLEAEGGPDAQLASILRQHWGVAGA